MKKKSKRKITPQIDLPRPKKVKPKKIMGGKYVTPKGSPKKGRKR